MMYEFDQRDVETAIERILQILNRSYIPADEREALRESLADVWDDIQVFRSEDAYSTHVAAYVADEYDRRHNPAEGQERRELPLCGCSSPTCALKRGELPAPARVNQGSILQTRRPEQAVSHVLQRHSQPFVLQEADGDWRRTVSGPLMDLLEVRAQAEQLDSQHDEVIQSHV